MLSIKADLSMASATTVPKQEPHKTKIIIIDGCETPIDAEIADAVLSLNQMGHRTRWCCIGGGYTVPYLIADTLPEELLRIAKKRRMKVTATSIYADEVIGQNLNQCSTAFVKLLSDFTKQ